VSGKNNSRAKAFTLIELLVVIAIIALLLSIVIPSLRKAKDHAGLVLCAGNQRQIVAAVGVYQGDNDGKLPPAIAGHTLGTGLGGMDHHWHRPTALNYMPNQDGALNGGYHGKYMAPYLSEVDVYNCPFSPIDSDSAVAFEGDRPITYQENYVNGIVSVDCTYMLLWNYQGFDNDLSPTRFIGPGSDKKNAAGLLICDVMFYTNNWIDPADRTWALTHPFKGASKDDDEIYYLLYDNEMDDMPKDVRFNAGYVDGSVIRFISDQTLICRNALVDMYLTKKLK
jgi:prepilin-type N-terminal cleavage/methylation domain-containing protein